MIAPSFAAPHQLRSGFGISSAHERSSTSTCSRCCGSSSSSILPGCGVCMCLPGGGRGGGGPQYIRVGGGGTCCWCIPRPQGRMRYFLAAVIGATIAVCYVMASFQYSFYVDDVYDVVGPRELNNFEKITIRVNKVPRDFADLRRFVEFHGICPAVHEIQVPWRVPPSTSSTSSSATSGTKASSSPSHPTTSTTTSSSLLYPDPPSADQFVFEKTHALLSFIPTESAVGCPRDAKQQQPATEGVLYMDVDVFMPCADIRRAIEAFRSSQDAAVGAFPRLHSSIKGSSESHASSVSTTITSTSTTPAKASTTTATTAATTSTTATSSPQRVAVEEYEYRGWPSVVWNRAYSVMLGAAIVVHGKYIESLCSSGEPLAAVERIVQRDSACQDLVLSLWMTSQGARGPLFMPSGYTTAELTYPLHSEPATHASRSQCLNELVAALGVTDIPVSVHKSVDSRHDWVW